MKRLILVCVLCLAVPVCGHAQTSDTAKQIKVEELFTAMHMERMMDQMMDAVKKMTVQATQTLPHMDELTPEQKDAIKDLQEQAMNLAMETIGWKAMEPEYVKLYASTYTEEEIDGMLTFFKSTAGQAMLAKTPQLTTASMEIVQKKMVELNPKLKALEDAFEEKIKQNAKPEKHMNQ